MTTKLSPAIERELGHATSIASTHGWPFGPAEASPELAWPANIAVYARMLRQDAQVAAIYRAVTLPIRRAAWRLDPNGAPPEVVALVAEDLGLAVVGEDRPPTRPRSKGRFSFDEHLRMALLSLVYGHMGFEQVYRIEAGRARLAKLGVRMPQTIAKINVADDGGLESVEQYSSGKPGTPLTAVIGIDRLVWYATDREGANWAGQSILRSAYKHWLLKDRLLRVQAMTIERNGMGVPTVEAPQGASPAQMAELNSLAQSYRAGESSGGAMPFGSRLRLVGVEGSLPDALPVIRYHDGAIGKEMLAQFLELGTTRTGSRALGSAFIDFFILALESLATGISSTLNEHVVEDLVDLNWGESTPAPRIVTSALDATNDIPPESLVTLIDSGAITPDDDLEVFLRQRYSLPRRGGAAHQPPPGPHSAPKPTLAGGRPKAPRRRTAAAALPGHSFATKLEAHYSTALADALGAGIDTTAVARAGLAAQPVAASAYDDAGLAIARAVLAAMGIDTTDVAAVMADLSLDAYAAGAHVGWGALPVAVRAAGDEPVASIDWSTWVPGDPRSAAELSGEGAGRGLAALLDQADATIAGVSGSALDDLAATLAEGVATGASIDEIAANLDATLGSRAAVIANTEVNRAMSVASMDTYRDNGIAGVEWLAESDADDECTENADASPLPIDEPFPSGDTEPPAHPNCRCAVSPVTADEMA